MYTYTILSTGWILRSDGLNIPPNAANMDYQNYLAWVAAGNTASTPTITEGELIAALQLQMDSVAQSYKYDNLLSACSYAAQAAGQPFQAEGAAFLAWRSAVWTAAYALLAEIEAGTATMPATTADAIAMMPAYTPPTS